ncbi:membrane transporter [Talaromyces proteolyticus]|uniref:Membrane transporter n=1 Tax=Talaromyces proteolyticus TaxID=1131652 RepID=A0AAD4Q245_9EURO|nr:membrane transporter [Talaromyces proteolyticus]KAH8699180.1 membrane transporter [Talaromyces proteolyticus]
MRITRPWTQNFISGVVLLLTVGIYLAVIGLGAGGGKASSAQVSTATYTTLYAVFALSGFFGGSIMNTIGPKWTMTIGAFGYPFYVSGLWYYDARGQEWYPLLGGVVIGLCAGLLWTVSGFIQFAYAEEKDKGTYIAWQLFLLNLGCTIGSSVAFGINFHDTSLNGVPISVYLIFIIIMTSAVALAFFAIVPPEDVRRDDGTHLAVFTAPDFRTEVLGCFELLKDWRIVSLIIPMAATEMSQSLIPTLSAYSFNLRTRSLNSVIYWLVQIPATFVYSTILDNTRFQRRVRGLMALTVGAIIVIANWALVLGLQIKHNLNRHQPSPEWDWSDPVYGEFVIMILLAGISLAIDQMAVMWILGAFSNEPRLLARYGGFFKAMLSAGLCVAFGLEAGSVSYL